MFIGEYQAKLDEKARVSVPAKFRAALKKKIVVTRGLDESLVIYTLEEWKGIASKLAALPITAGNSRAFSRLMLSGAMDLEIDSQGRVNLPQYLLDYAGIEKKLIFAGLYNRIEIWAEEKWDRYKADMEKNATEIAEQMAGL